MLNRSMRPRVRGFLGAALALAGLPVFAGSLSAQNAVLSGRVTDVRSGAPLAGAEVRVLDSGLRARTDVVGAYRIEGLAAGSYAVEAVLAGYRSVQRAVTLPADGVHTLDFALDAAVLRAPQVDVVGPTAEALERIPGSAAVVDEARLREQLPLTGNEVLRTVPGVHVQEEEGLGMRANVGIRGLDPDRSRTVLVLEDGVPVALAPYGEPEMYYTPPIDRMARVEVVKGSGSILFGPQTVGGVINYVTPAPPATPTTTLDLRSGSGGLLHAEARFGGTWSNAGTHVGVLRKQADDLNGLFFEITDLTGKVAFGVGERSEVALKLSVYDEESNSTYVGLTEAMFAADPTQHPAPDDRLWVRRIGGSITHEIFLGANALLRTTAYGHTIRRDWMRQDYNSGDPNRTTIVLRGTTGNRNRSFEVLGIEPRLQLDHRLAGIRSELDAGLRFHYEHAEDAYVVGGSPTARTGVMRDFEVRTGRAVAAYLQNRFALSEQLFFTPGVRMESFSFDRNILRRRVNGVPTDVDLRSEDRITEVIPGVGVSWLPAPRLTVFAGAHRGFAPPRIKDAFVVEAGAGGSAELVSLELDAERSWNLELGTRAAPLPGVELEATAFLLDFTNQIIAASQSGGVVADLVVANQGATRHTGVESALGIDLARLAGLPFGFVGELKHTYVRAVFSADRAMRNPNTGAMENVEGNRLPYAPEHLLVAGLALELPVGLRLRLDGVHTGEQFSDNFETRETRPDGQVGLIPAHTVWNAAATYRLGASGLELFGTLKNVFDRTYIASRRPEGIKPGLPRTLQLGARVTF